MFSKNWLTQISIVSSSWMLVKSGSTSKLPIDKVGSCSYIYSANWNESLTVYSFLVKGFDMTTKNLARLYVGVCKADKIRRNGGQPSTCCLYTLQFPYKIPGLVATSFTNLRISFDILLESTSFLKMVSTRFSWLTRKFRKASSFKVTFPNFLWTNLKYFPFF